MNGWIPNQPDVKASDYVFREGDFFGVDRNAPLVRWGIYAPRPRGIFQRLRDAWFGMLNGFKYGPGDD